MFFLKEKLLDVLTLVFGLFVLILIPYQIDGSFGPKLFPYLITTTLIILSIASILLGFKSTNKKSDSNEREDVDEKTSGYGRLLFIVVCIIFWIFLLPILGFIITTFLVTVASMFYLGYKHFFRLFIISAVFTFATYYIFVVLLNVRF